MPLSLKEHATLARSPLPDDAVLLGRARLLPETDRDFFLVVWSARQSLRRISSGGQTSLSAARRRFRRLLGRLNSDAFVAVARVRRLLSPQHYAVARLHFFHGLSERRTAEALHLGYHRTRRLIAEVRGAAGVGRPPAPSATQQKVPA